MKFIDSYLAQEKIITSDTSGFYKCISQQSFTKNDEIKVDEALNWCKQESLYTILCKCLFSEVTVEAVTELDDKTAHCHAPVPQRHRPFL
ncbi:hypothetical protein [Klebsiella pneumoniae]|uniref:hypothetical protein n=1 Tax=Klebsiella pneumoniae TaxID=573 RepID=UPI0014386CE5|nr:hypothetical protein [Klebsiella pneumoniae]